ncbi:MAG: PP2C family serine/threonine-protein phosphatase [Gammaproteobacteria bacterium]
MNAVVSMRPPAGLPSYTATVSGPRSPTNEDAVLCLNDYGVFGVFDGMGGHRNGARASALATASLQRAARSAPEHNAAFFERALLEANAAIVRDAATTARGETMGTTAAMCWIHDDKMTCFHAGDSRVYRMRDFRLDRITRDHHREADVREHIGLGQHSVRAITRALGMGSALRVEVTETDWQPGDLAMLCTDGLSDVLPDFQCANIIVDYLERPAQLPDALLRAASSSTDDCSVIVVVG